MSHWRRQRETVPRSREATLTYLIEVIDRINPATVTDLTRDVGLSEHYTAELVQELKAKGLISKAYIVDSHRVYEVADELTPLGATEDSDEEILEPGSDLIEVLSRLAEATSEQFDAVRSRFRGVEPDHSAAELEPLVDERYETVIETLKSYTITTDWPGNRAAADLATMARYLEQVGNRLAFISETLDSAGRVPTGSVADRIADLLETGAHLQELFTQIVFDHEIDRFVDLKSETDRFNRDLDELFELSSSYQSDAYAVYVTIGRALEWIGRYWIQTAELAVHVHTGLSRDRGGL